MKVVSYNLRKHRAINELAALDERYSPDLMCLQECDTTDLPQHIGHLWGDVAALFAVAAVLAFLTPRGTKSLAQRAV